VHAGKDDWRLPTFDEVRTLLEAVFPSMEGGFCPASSRPRPKAPAVFGISSATRWHW
jgi:hypothetical protein